MTGVRKLEASDDRRDALERQIARLARPFGDMTTELEGARSHAAAHPSAGATRRVAWIAAVGGRFEEARQILVEASSDADDFGNAHYAIGMLAIGCGDHELARDSFRQAVERASIPPDKREALTARLDDDPARRFGFPLFLDQIGLPDFAFGFEAFSVPQRCSTSEYQAYSRLMERACPAMGSEHDAVRDMLEEDREINGESFWRSLYLGHYAWIAGDRIATDIHYAHARQEALARKLEVSHYNSGIFSWIDAARALSPDPSTDPFEIGDWKVADSAAGRSGAELSLLIGSDGNYFKYFPKFFHSLLATDLSRSRTPILLHYIVANPTAEQQSLLDKLLVWTQKNTPWIRLVVQSGALRYKEPAIYTCLRFLALPGLLERTDAPVLILDIDNLLGPDLHTRLLPLGGAEFGLRRHDFDSSGRQLRGEPWSAINASQIYLGRSPTRGRFAAMMRNIIERSYDPALPTNWTIDQSALGQTMREIAPAGSTLPIVDLSRIPSITIMPHEVGGKDALLALGGVVEATNFLEAIDDVINAAGATELT